MRRTWRFLHRWWEWRTLCWTASEWPEYEMHISRIHHDQPKTTSTIGWWTSP
jgi:hypothetical protein